MNDRVNTLLKILYEIYPEKISFITENDPWRFLVTVMLSASTTDRQAIKVAAELYEAGYRKASLKYFEDLYNKNSNKANSTYYMARINQLSGNREEASKLFDEYLSKINGEKVVFLELGVGYNTPTIIRLPFEHLVFNNPNSYLIRINKDFPNGVEENKHKIISFDEDISLVIEDLLA